MEDITITELNEINKALSYSGFELVLSSTSWVDDYCLLVRRVKQ